MQTSKQTLKTPDPEPILFTREAYEKIQADFDRLTIERVAVMKRLQIAREMGDLSENGAYKYAKIELGDIGRELRRLKHLLAIGQIQDTKPNRGIVEFGRTVTVQIENNKNPKTFLIVTQHESNPMAGKLALESPLGLVLLGKKVGDEVTFQAPAGPMKYTITAIE